VRFFLLPFDSAFLFAGDGVIWGLGVFGALLFVGLVPLQVFTSSVFSYSLYQYKGCFQ
jgi:hypothetical protein